MMSTDLVENGGDGGKGRAMSARAMEVIRSLDSRSFGFLDFQQTAAGPSEEPSFLSRDFIQQGIEQLRSDLSISPQSDVVVGELCCRLAHLHLLLEEYDHAHSAYQQCLRVCPESSSNCTLLYGQALVYMHYNAYKRAEDLFHRILQLAPLFGRANEIHLRLGMIAKRQGDVATSLHHLQQAVQIPGSTSLSRAEIMFHIGHLQHTQGQCLLARQTYEGILSSKSLLGKIRAKTLRQLGWLYHTVPEVCHPTEDAQGKAVELLKLAVGADPSSGTTWYFLGRCHAAQGRAHEAFMAYQQAVNKCPDSQANIWCSIGILYHNMGQPRDCLQSYLCAVYLDIGHASSWSDLGCLYEAVSQPIDALICYKNAEKALLKGGAGKLESFVHSRISCLEQFIVASGTSLLAQPRSLPAFREAWHSLIPSHIKSRQPQSETPLLQLPGLCSPSTPSLAFPSPPSLGRHCGFPSKRIRASRAKDPIILRSLSDTSSAGRTPVPSPLPPTPSPSLLQMLNPSATPTLQSGMGLGCPGHSRPFGGADSLQPSSVDSSPSFPAPLQSLPFTGLTGFGRESQKEFSPTNLLGLQTSVSPDLPSDLDELSAGRLGDVMSTDDSLFTKVLGQKRKSGSLSSPPTPHPLSLPPATPTGPVLPGHAPPPSHTAFPPHLPSDGLFTEPQVTGAALPRLSSPAHFPAPPAPPHPLSLREASSDTTAVLDSILSGHAPPSGPYPTASVLSLTQQYPHATVPAAGNLSASPHHALPRGFPPSLGGSGEVCTGGSGPCDPQFSFAGPSDDTHLPDFRSSSIFNLRPHSVDLGPAGPAITSVAMPPSTAAPPSTNHHGNGSNHHDDLPPELADISPFVASAHVGSVVLQELSPRSRSNSSPAPPTSSAPDTKAFFVSSHPHQMLVAGPPSKLGTGTHDFDPESPSSSLEILRGEQNVSEAGGGEPFGEVGGQSLVTPGDPFSPRQPLVTHGDPFSPRQPFVTHGDPFSPQQSLVAHGNPFSPRRPLVTHGNPLSLRQPLATHGDHFHFSPRQLLVTPSDPFSPRQPLVAPGDPFSPLTPGEQEDKALRPRFVTHPQAAHPQTAHPVGGLASFLSNGTSSSIQTAPALRKCTSDSSSGVSSASTMLSTSSVSDTCSPLSSSSSPPPCTPSPPTPSLVTPIPEPNPSLGSPSEYMAQMPRLFPPKPPPHTDTVNLQPDVPIFHVSSREEVFSKLHSYCSDPTLPVCMIRGMVDVLGLDLDAFSTDTLVGTCAEQEMEVREQFQQAADKNWDPTGQKLVWFCESNKSVTTVAEYASYQTSVLHQHNKDEGPLPSHLIDQTEECLGRGRKRALRFGTNVDLSDAYKWEKQLEELRKLPKFLQVDCLESNFLTHIGHTILGMNSVQLYMKVPGSRTPGHQENNNFCSVNVNIGPGGCEWFAVPNPYWGVFHQLCEKHKLSFLVGSWWPVLEELRELQVPVYRFTQLKGDVVWINAGTVHWVQANDVCNNIAWNVGPFSAHQFKMAWERYRWNRVQKVRSIVPMIHLTWNVVRSLKISNPTLYQQIRSVLETSLAQTKRLMSHLEKAKVTVHWHGRIPGEPAPCCQNCLDEVFNILFVLSHKGEYLVYCHKCAAGMNKSFTVLQQYNTDELEQTLASFKCYQTVTKSGR